MNGNIVGEEFDEFVVNQIKARQGNQFSGYNSLRTNDQLQYLTNRNAWVKLASSVNILVDTINSPSSFTSSKLNNIGLDPSIYLGTKLAEEAILFNTLSSYVNSTSPLNSTRAGISNTNTLWNNNFAYGIGGTEFGIQPPPGIISTQIDSLNRGSIRKASVVLKAHNKFQFDLIELLYLRLGFTMMLEWGWDKYIDDNNEIQEVRNTIIEEKWFSTNSTTQLEMLRHIQEMREKYEGNCDGFFGKVSNFTWSFNPDGTYDITIDLITVGDVIESLKVNTFSKEGFTSSTASTFEVQNSTNLGLDSTNISKAATLSSIGYFLYKKIEAISLIGTSPTPGVVRLRNIGEVNDPNDDTTPYVKLTPIDTSVNSQYYIRLGELLAQLENLVIPLIQNDNKTTSPQIYISHTVDENIISYFPNQISLDPKICIFRPVVGGYGDITGITFPQYLDALDQYVTILNTPPNETYGLLMNLYMNMEFITGLLVSNGGPDQQLSLFKFLQDLCNGINNALGGVNKLEPIIKKDSIVTLIDQTLSANMPIEVDLEVYGYNPSNLNKGQPDPVSNFVKDIKFVSKITPQLASMISIGATAAGSSTSEIDGTAFSKFSEGLEDRFAREILEPEGLSQLPPLATDRAEYQKIFNTFPTAIPLITRIFASIFRIQSLNNSAIFRKVKSNFYGVIDGQIMDFEKFYVSALEIDKQNEQKGFYKREDIKNLVDKNYSVYLANAFGGTIPNITVQERKITRNGGPGRSASYTSTFITVPLKITTPQYFQYNDTFITQGKAAYKNYLNVLNNERYKNENIPSSEVGFIPLSFDLIVDGISGILIYNKLNINSRFLPSNYPESLKFIITKVNHSISNNSWETSLSTISMPNTKPYVFNASFTTTSSGDTGGTGIKGPQPDNGTPFLIVDNRNNRNIMTLDALLSELDPVARPLFRKFFNTLKTEYSGYKAGVNAIRRTWEQSYNLKYTPGYPSYAPSNAEPGKSRHSYGLAIDINIETPTSTTKRTLKRDVKGPWIEEGIDKVAKDAGLLWGGNFNDVDAVHFEFNYNTNTAYIQVLTQAGAIDPTLIPPFTPFANGLVKVKKIDSLIKQGKIKLQ